MARRDCTIRFVRGACGSSCVGTLDTLHASQLTRRAQFTPAAFFFSQARCRRCGARGRAAAPSPTSASYSMLTQLLISASLPSVRAKSQGDGISLDTLPPAVRDAGVAAFGSISALSAILKKTRVRQLRTLDGAVTLQLASIDGDKSVSHLRREMRSDRYEISKLRDDGGDGVVVDIGANLGYLSLTVAKLYPRMRVLSIEPTPPTFFLLLVNLHLNRVPILSPSTFIARDAGGVLPLHAATGGAGAAVRANGMRLRVAAVHLPL